MISTSNKPTTLRTAVAQAVFSAEPFIIQTLRNGEGPKGDAKEIARVAGIMAGKRTHELIPFCHQLPIDQINIRYEWAPDRVTIFATATAVWKTGVEMEAIVAAQLCATTMYDMMKAVSTSMEMKIEDVYLLSKRGGKTDFQECIPENFTAAVIVTSDGTSAGTRQDKSGVIIRERLASKGVNQVEYMILPDEADQIRNALLDLCDKNFDLIITTGGTGLGPRDVTANATRMVIDAEIPGIMEAARQHGQMRTPYAMLSKGVAGLRGSTMIINLPGSSKGAAESLDAIFPAILHGYPMMKGGGH